MIFTFPSASRRERIFVGNEADPVTPFRSAKAVADALGDSAILVEQDDYGHLSLAMHSECTLNILGDYFLNNKLPTTDQFCGTNQVLFPGPGITKDSLGNKNGPVDLQTQLEETQARARQLTGAAIALACAIGLLSLFLLWSWLIGKKGRRGGKDVVYWGKDGLHDGQGYDTPHGGVTALKLGGYAPVKT
ncbi:hypothetical protein FRC07_012565 [Ceratobasidium sp. 392]|nr:hypothetical protein FRC07_012565 [Ceratobasidium sp. 392]